MCQVASTSFNKLLNRLLAVKVDMQQKIFSYFTAFQVGSLSTACILLPSVLVHMLCMHGLAAPCS